MKISSFFRSERTNPIVSFQAFVFLFLFLLFLLLLLLLLMLLLLLLFASRKVKG